MGYYTEYDTSYPDNIQNRYIWYLSSGLKKKKKCTLQHSRDYCYTKCRINKLTDILDILIGLQRLCLV